MLALIKSLLPSAKSGSLKILEISDNNVLNEEAADALATLIELATNLQVMDISDSNISEEEVQTKIIDAIKTSKSKDKLTGFQWNYDLDDRAELAEGLARSLNDFDNIQAVSLQGSIGSKTTRD